MLCVPVWNQDKISYLSVPLGYRMWKKKESKLELAATMIRKVMPEFQSREHVIILCDSWYTKQNLVCISMNIRTWILLVMQGLILLCMTLLLHIPAAGGVRLNMENSFLLRLTLPFPVKKSVITIPVSAVSLPESLAIRKFWLMSQPQKKSMVKNACFQYDFSRRTADFLCMAGKSTIESDRQ